MKLIGAQSVPSIDEHEQQKMMKMEKMMVIKELANESSTSQTVGHQASLPAVGLEPT